MFLPCHVRISEWIHTPKLPECQGTPCSKQRMTKMAHCFPEFLFSFPEVPFIYCAHLFQRMHFFPSWLYLSLPSSELLREIICLVLVSFPLGTLCWSTYDAFFITLKPLHDFFLYFIKIVASMMVLRI